ncbi:MAG: hypothetical protein LUB59_05870 [Candidatus Gastranaerophilales bacterium]|nr:hypothetical protein [Candidatus Gastranaerophilales bacterium]
MIEFDAAIAPKADNNLKTRMFSAYTKNKYLHLKPQRLSEKEIQIVKIIRKRRK